MLTLIQLTDKQLKKKLANAKERAGLSAEERERRRLYNLEYSRVYNSTVRKIKLLNKHDTRDIE